MEVTVFLRATHVFRIDTRLRDDTLSAAKFLLADITLTIDHH
uniref:Uncharacterized protein n=1 Tax=Oryza sativa subsp. japonica TaxID=39947 RepID=Q10EC4_ORYSJ|nr:hypothetical protein LOC_Os03g56149 [Oryza sativa Japonica Group]